MDQKTEGIKTAEAQANSRLASTNEIYQERADNLAAASDKVNEEREQRDKDANLESVEQDLPEEQRFVANPDNLRKDVDSEEKFSEDLEDGKDTLETPGGQTKAPAKKAAAKK
jgi:hypothetical protein